MFATLPGRSMDVTSCIVLVVLLQTAVAAFVVTASTRWGRPSAWPRGCKTVFVAGCVAASLAVVWIDRPVEGARLVTLTRDHSVTAGDLLAVPYVLMAVLVLLAVRD